MGAKVKAMWTQKRARGRADIRVQAAGGHARSPRVTYVAEHGVKPGLLAGIICEVPLVSHLDLGLRPESQGSFMAARPHQERPRRSCCLVLRWGVRGTRWAGSGHSSFTYILHLSSVGSHPMVAMRSLPQNPQAPGSQVQKSEPEQ